MLTLWLPLVPVDRTSGALSLVKGSHRLGKIWPATVPPEERSLDRKTTFSDLVPRPAVVGRDPSAEWGVSENWPQGVGQYGEIVAAEMKPGDLLAFHNMIMCAPNLARWSDRRAHGWSCTLVGLSGLCTELLGVWQARDLAAPAHGPSAMEYRLAVYE